MPELPEVETVRRGLAKVFEGGVFAKVELARGDLRFPFPKNFAARLKGRRVEALDRRGKYLLARLDDGASLLMHLGMSGSFRIDHGGPIGDPYIPRGRNPAHDHVIFRFESGASVTYNDPRRFGYMLLLSPKERESHPLLKNLGAEPLSAELNAAALAKTLADRSAPLKAALSDQKTIAGLGNIYVCEALHRAGLSPLRAAGSLVSSSGRATAALTKLTRAIKEVLSEAIEAGGSSLRDHRQTNGDLGYFQHSFRVYDREGAACPKKGCKGTIARIVQAGRSTFYCPMCQK
ncbi:bifunctional DNA-formamidopyrimidine glycosylase/DNA-(apurinic or apyrimidinic site) lyase [Methylocystis bryophila]|uniref:Formamidopyrimidine-DNA glycosylase n=1 Tax=Methylocystis bryophila TaxID=655015 RepID=A0A1W6MRB1_9HYPH|nr:bifunctional DNA-formamidopyrimidine glycosylase/DNA-(apurinic or apyrimidinic site) lyase [Methylocystis bryophila]ARN80086.1 DNA-formamidopyrimidine glycosylase [Methylocystis bryophila]BDV40013.1 formamidopyrimidine-DNA glycosylase [Methylocystis bryophila]